MLALIREVLPRVFQVDLKPSGLEGLISSYILAGEKAAIVDPGPSSVIPPSTPASTLMFPDIWFIAPAPP